MIWLALGSGPSAPSTLNRLLLSDVPWSKTITCNAGIKLLPAPDFYLCVDMCAQQEYAQAARDAQRSGTQLATLSRDAAALKSRCADFYDLYIDEDPRALPHVGGYGRFRYSGPLMLEVALNHGAREIHLVGFDGYDPSGMMYFDQADRSWHHDPFHRKHREDRSAMCHAVTQEALQRVSRAWTGCEFVQHGPTSFEIGEPNWRRIGGYFPSGG